MAEEEPTDAVRRDRFSGGPARGFLSSLAADERIFEADLAVDRAHVVMLAEHDTISQDEAAAILDALAGVEADGFTALPAGEDVHSAIETAVIDRAGDVGGKMHTARSRNDEVATCIRHRLRDDLLAAAAAAVELRGTFLTAATAHRETVMPGYTHLQPAQPTTVGHWLLSYESGLRRDTARLLDAYHRVNRSPLGAAAFAGTPFSIDRTRTANLLGFEDIIENAMDAASARDFLIESIAALSALACNLSGLAADVILFANRGFVELADEYASTSSIMPQKKNPDTLELVRATLGDAVGALTAVLTILKGLPRAYNRDLQRATPHVWEAVDAVSAATRVVDGAVGSAQWNADVLAAAASEGFSTATGVADLLAMTGIPFRKAHEVVATASTDDRSRDRFAALDAAARDVLGEPLDAIVDREQLERALDPLENVYRRDSVGGPAPSAVETAVQRATAELETHEATIDAAREQQAAAAERLETEVKRYTT